MEDSIELEYDRESSSRESTGLGSGKLMSVLDKLEKFSDSKGVTDLNVG